MKSFSKFCFKIWSPNAELLMGHCLLLLAPSSWTILTWSRKALRLVAILCWWNAVFTVIYQCCSCTFMNSWIFRYGVLFISWSSRWMWLWKICSPDGKYVREHVRGLLLDYSTYQILWSLVNYQVFHDESYQWVMYVLEKTWELHTNSGSVASWV